MTLCLVIALPAIAIHAGIPRHQNPAAIFFYSYPSYASGEDMTCKTYKGNDKSRPNHVWTAI